MAQWLGKRCKLTQITNVSNSFRKDLIDDVWWCLVIFGDAWWCLMVWWCLIVWCFVSQHWKTRKSNHSMSCHVKKHSTWLMSSVMLPCHHPGIDKCVNWRHLKNILRYPVSFFQYIGSFSFQKNVSSHQILTPRAGRKMLKKSSHQLSD